MTNLLLFVNNSLMEPPGVLPLAPGTPFADFDPGVQKEALWTGYLCFCFLVLLYV